MPGIGPVDNGPTRFDADNVRREPGGMSGLAHDSVAEDRTLRAQLRRMGVPVGDEGGLGNLRKIARQYGLATAGGMAMDQAPRASSDVDSPLDAIAHIGTLSYAGRVLTDPPRARAPDVMAADDGGGMNSIASYFPEIAARWARNERAMFAVPVDKGSVRADERNAARRSRGGGMPMAYDAAALARNRGDAASVERMFPGLNLDRIGNIR